RSARDVCNHGVAPRWGAAAEADGACKLSVSSSECLPAEGIVAAFNFVEFRHVHRRLGNQAISTFPIAEGASSSHCYGRSHRLIPWIETDRASRSPRLCFLRTSYHTPCGTRWTLSEAYCSVSTDAGSLERRDSALAWSEASMRS